MNELLNGVIGGALITGVLSPLILQAKDIRTNRADVLKAILDVELKRWANGNSYNDFRRTVSLLRATALIARSNRSLVDQYIYIATVCRRNSDIDLANSSSPEQAGMILTSLNNIARTIADDLIITLWHPYRSKPFIAKRVSKNSLKIDDLKKENDRVSKKENDIPISWDVVV